MKVLLINNCHWPRGGSESVYFNTAKLLKEQGHEVFFFSREDEQNIKTGNKEYFISQPGGLKKIRNIFSNSEAACKLDEILYKERPDIAHAHLFWGGISPSIFAVLKKHRVPLVHTAHDYRMVCPAYLLTDGNGQICARCKNGEFYNCALYKCSRGSIVESTLLAAEMYYRNRKWHPAKGIDGIIFVSNFSKQKHLEFDQRLGTVKTMVLYNCPEKKVKESLDMTKNTFDGYYLFYGRLSEEKGIPTLLKAFEKFPHLKLKVAGTGPMEEYLKSNCIEKGLSNIDFLGYKRGKDLFDLVAGAKYVCVPSECYENNPMTIVEAYSMGVPVIGANIGGIPEIVEEGRTGFLFESGNVESLSEAIARSVFVGNDEYIEMKKVALRFSGNHFDREKYKERLMKFYQDVIKGSRV